MPQVCFCPCRHFNRQIVPTWGNYLLTGHRNGLTCLELFNFFDENSEEYSCFPEMVFSLVSPDHLKKLLRKNSECQCCERHQNDRPNFS